MSKCSLLLMVGFDPKKSEGKEVEISERAGMKFIKLLHNTGSGTGDKGVQGFQGAKVAQSEGQSGRVILRYELSKNATGLDCPVLRNLIFYKDEDTGDLVAFVPDTEFNRRKLKGTYCKGASWKIVDKEIAKEIRAAYDADAEEQEINKTKDQVISEQADALKKTTEELEALKAGKLHEEVRQEVVVKSKELAEIRETVTEQVKAEKAEFIEGLKAQSKNFWLKPEYKKEVNDEIDRRVQEIVNAKSAKPRNDNQF
jgi:hypothetical protein